MSKKVTETIVKEALKVVKNTKVLIKEIDEINEWNSYSKALMNIGKFVSFVEGIVITVENVFHAVKKEITYDSGAVKLDAAVEIIDDMISLPLWLELVDEYIIKIVISIVVHYINDKYGHDWKLKVK